jgi:hypothetical protein
VRRLRAAVVLAATAHLGCWSFVSGPSGLATPKAPGAAATEVILRVNEAGVAWGDGTLADEVREALVRSGRYAHVYHPVEPLGPPDLVVEVEAVGDFHEPAAWSVLAAFVIGYFYIAPAFVVPLFEDYDVTCKVRVREGAATVRQFTVESEASVTYAAFASRERFVTEARERIFVDLAERIAAGVAAP